MHDAKVGVLGNKGCRGCVLAGKIDIGFIDDDDASKAVVLKQLPDNGYGDECACGISRGANEDKLDGRVFCDRSFYLRTYLVSKYILVR